MNLYIHGDLSLQQIRDYFKQAETFITKAEELPPIERKEDSPQQSPLILSLGQSSDQDPTPAKVKSVEEVWSEEQPRLLEGYRILLKAKESIDLKEFSSLKKIYGEAISFDIENIAFNTAEFCKSHLETNYPIVVEYMTKI